MSLMSKTMNLPQISKILQDFERESSSMDMKEEMMSDTIDDVMEDDGETEEEESDKILKQVLDEIGVSVSQQVSPFSIDRFYTIRVLEETARFHQLMLPCLIPSSEIHLKD
jgi:division protein CdvB (Snf7/Vps24/ESCRT-III family)